MLPSGVPSGIRSEGAWINDLADGDDGGLPGFLRCRVATKQVHGKFVQRGVMVKEDEM